MAWAVIFLASVIAAVAISFFAPLPRSGRVVIAASAVVLLLVFYLTASESPISPFGRGGIAFGIENEIAVLVVGIVGALAGVVGSVFFRLDEKGFNLRDFIKPLATSPLVLIPTVKLFETTGEANLTAYVLLFALSYQNGFFWERMLKQT
jgi:hypothetical protein